MLSVIEGLEYRPFDATLVGNPCIEVGDAVRLHTKYQIIDSYVLQRTLSGVQALRDEFSAEGEEYQSEKVNDIQTQITQLRGKSNTLERTIDQTRSMIADVEEDLQSEITQTAEQIELKVSKGDVSSEISTEADGITIRGNRLIVESDNFSLDANGSAEATNFACRENLLFRDGESEFNLISGYISDWGAWLCSIGSQDVEQLNITSDSIAFFGSASIIGNFHVSGTKSRLANTENYNERLLYCYETPSPFFGDIGHGVIGEDGTCYVDIDSIFAETIDTVQEYYVFLTPYKTDKAMFVSEKEHGYFIVKGEPNTEFDWEIKAKQLDFPMERLEENIVEDTNDIDYEEQAINYLNEYEKELTNYEY